MSQENIRDSEVDIVIGALQSDLTEFLNAWRPIFSRFHLIIVKDPDLKEELKMPEGFDHHVYTKSDIDRVVGSSNSILFSGYSCRYFGHLVSRKKYIISIDDDCLPAKENDGYVIDVVGQHIINLTTPATPCFFNKLYYPGCEGVDFVRGYPSSLRSGVNCALSCGDCIYLDDNVIWTGPARTLLPISRINIAFDREVVGPALFPGLRLAGEGNQRWETIVDNWCVMCVKVVCDHLGHGIKSGLPYMWRKIRGNPMEIFKKDQEGVKLMEEILFFFRSVRLPPTATTAEDCLLEMAKALKEQVKNSDPMFVRATEAMEEWVKIWKVAGAH